MSATCITYQEYLFLYIEMHIEKGLNVLLPNVHIQAYH